MEAADDGRLASPFFSGGTGRSGTTVLAKLLDRHPEVGRCVPWEARFLTDRFGLCDLVDARLRGPSARLAVLTTGNVARFEQRLRGRWFRRRLGDGNERGLYQAVSATDIDQALVGFRSRLSADPVAAAAELSHRLLDPAARRRGRQRWIETTPDNALRAHQLIRIFPAMKLVHIIRDGRDTAASVAARYWGPNTLDQALTWWERRSLAIHLSIRGLPADRVLTVQLEDLVARRREQTLAAVLDFLGLSHAPEVLGFHAEQMRPEDAHLGRWRTGLEPARASAFEARYEAALERLRRAGARVPG